jgi:hypothetical protein
MNMTSYPLIESAVSRTEAEFMCFVERHAADRDSLYEADGDVPGDTVRITVAEQPMADDVSERRHTVEFMTLGGDGHWEAVGCIGHSMRQIETMSGRWVQIQSTFEIHGPRIPEGRFAQSQIEPVVQDQLDRLRAARLLPLRSQPPVAVPEACAA